MFERRAPAHAARRSSLAALTALAGLLAFGSGNALAANLAPGNYQAAPGEANALTVTDTGASLTFVDTGATITAAGLCTPLGANAPGATVTCPDNGSLLINLSDLDDQTSFSGTFAGPSGGASVAQFGGDGADTLRGPDGGLNVSNNLNGGAGADNLIGGSARDTADYSALAADIKVSLDDVANDGAAGEGDNVRSTVENVVTGSGNDTITASTSDNNIFSGGGNDTIFGGAGDDLIGAGGGADTLLGEAGNDRLSGGETAGNTVDGSDLISGGTGTDTTNTSAFGPSPQFAGLAVSITLDDVPDDGFSGEGDNYGSDIEDVFIGSDGPNTIVGTAAINILTTSDGNDAVTGGAGSDILTTLEGDDTINARDGFLDRVDCGAGTDTAVADTLDVVLSNCENVQTADVGSATEDAPPTVAFVTPAENALLPGRASTVTVNASDARGIARVVLIDDGAVVGVDTSAPYEFSYQPKGSDVGKNVLIAQAVDALSQTATAVRVVRVDRFTPARVSETVTPARDRTRPFRFRVSGTVSRPTGVTAAQGCRAGTVRITGKQGTRTRVTRTARLRTNCTYAASVAVGSRVRLRFTARFSGNAVLKARSSAGRNVRAG